MKIPLRPIYNILSLFMILLLSNDIKAQNIDDFRKWVEVIAEQDSIKPYLFMHEYKGRPTLYIREDVSQEALGKAGIDFRVLGQTMPVGDSAITVVTEGYLFSFLVPTWMELTSFERTNAGWTIRFRTYTWDREPQWPLIQGSATLIQDSSDWHLRKFSFREYERD